MVYQTYNISNAIKEDQMDSDILLKQVIRRLDVLVALQVEAIGEHGTAAKINKLSELGLTASEVASIVAKPPNYVTATLSTKRKQKKRKESKNER
jgi:hypothetical protein